MELETTPMTMISRNAGGWKSGRSPTLKLQQINTQLGTALGTMPCAELSGVQGANRITDTLAVTWSRTARKERGLDDTCSEGE